MRMSSLFLAVLATGVLAGCASGVVREAPPAGAPASALVRTPVSQVSLSLTPAAQKMASENPDFNRDVLLASVRRTLEAKGLVSKDAAAPRAEIVLSELRARSTASAELSGVPVK